MIPAMSSLPIANAEITQFFRNWLETFADYVREVDYASARPLFHPDVLAFGTHNDVIPGLDQWVSTQWDNVWPKTSDLRFVIEQTSVLASADGAMATVIAPWTSTGYHPDGSAFPRPGRATMVVFKKWRQLAVCAFAHVAQSRRAAGKPCQSAGEGLVDRLPPRSTCKGPGHVRGLSMSKCSAAYSGWPMLTFSVPTPSTPHSSLSPT